MKKFKKKGNFIFWAFSNVPSSFLSQQHNPSPPFPFDLKTQRSCSVSQEPPFPLCEDKSFLVHLCGKYSECNFLQFDGIPRQDFPVPSCGTDGKGNHYWH